MRVYENISLKAYNTFGIDVKARRLVVVEPEDSVESVADSIRSQKVLVIGAGSNMVFTKDYDGTVITLAHSSVNPCRADSSPNLGEQQDSNDLDNSSSPKLGKGDRPKGGGGVCGPLVITAWGGMVMDDLVQWTIGNGLYGLENLSAIPGTVGASAVQNVGAYGSEAKDFIERVEAYDLEKGRMVNFTNADCKFAYRDSLFKHHPGRYIILRVTYRLNNEYVPNLSYKALEGVPHGTAQELRDAIADIRWGKLPRPEEHGSAGSFFKNPVVDEETYLRLRAEYPEMPEAHRVGSVKCVKLSAGWLIDRAGWKGKTMGRAGVWPKNALVLYNAAGCTGDEIVALAAAIQQDVKQKFGVRLEPEAIII